MYQTHFLTQNRHCTLHWAHPRQIWPTTDTRWSYTPLKMMCQGTRVHEYRVILSLLYRTSSNFISCVDILNLLSKFLTCESIGMTKTVIQCDPLPTGCWKESNVFILSYNLKRGRPSSFQVFLPVRRYSRYSLSSRWSYLFIRPLPPTLFSITFACTPSQLPIVLSLPPSVFPAMSSWWFMLTSYGRWTGIHNHNFASQNHFCQLHSGKDHWTYFELRKSTTVSLSNSPRSCLYTDLQESKSTLSCKRFPWLHRCFGLKENHVNETVMGPVHWFFEIDNVYLLCTLSSGWYTSWSCDLTER